MPKIERLQKTLLKSDENSRDIPTFKYYLSDFIDDWHRHPDGKWGEILEYTLSLLKDTFDKSMMRDKKLRALFNLPEIETNQENVNNFDPLSLNNTIKYKPDSRTDWAEEAINEIQKCLLFFNENQESTLFKNEKKKRNRNQQIPFYGGVNDFAFFFNLIECYGVFFLTERVNDKKLSEHLEMIFHASAEDAKMDLENYLVQKKEFYNSLCDFFIVVKQDSKSTKKIEISQLEIQTIKSKAGGPTFPYISKQTWNAYTDGINEIIEFLKNSNNENQCSPYKEELPYRTSKPQRRSKKIPFLGGIDDFAYFIKLFEKVGMFFLTENFCIEKLNTSPNSQEEFSSESLLSDYLLEQSDYCKLLCDLFYGLKHQTETISNGNQKFFNEEYFDPQDLDRLLRNSDMPKISKESKNQFKSSFNAIAIELEERRIAKK